MLYGPHWGEPCQRARNHPGICVSKLSGCTSDNANNIVSAMRIFEWAHFRCFGHTLQLGVKEAMEIPQVSRAIGRAKWLVSHFHHLPKSTYVFRQKQSHLKRDQLSLVQVCEYMHYILSLSHTHTHTHTYTHTRAYRYSLCSAIAFCILFSSLQDVSTRWNSSYFMLKRIQVQQQPICAALIELRKTDLCHVKPSFRPWRLSYRSWNPLLRSQQL